MRIVVQRVKQASVTVNGSEISCIGKGFLLFVGIAKQDNSERALYTAEKISRLRIFEDSEGKMNLGIKEASGEILSVPQFTLLANTEKGNRPSFDNAALPEKAETLWIEFNERLRQEHITVKEGKFGAHMEIALINDGLVTIVMDS
ncbi:MAG: D-aminoacyl-tRNA deacylase [Candidatus Omnitrophota bacterium]